MLADMRIQPPKGEAHRSSHRKVPSAFKTREYHPTRYEAASRTKQQTPPLLTDVANPNLLGLVKHLSLWESRYLGEVFGRPFPELLPRWDDTAERGADLWATEHETREEITDRYRRVGEHSDATITALALDSPGYVPWWPRPTVKLFNILVHTLTETSRHVGHADILREQLDGSTGTTAEYADQYDGALRGAHRAKIERAAKAAAEQDQNLASP
ncbi:DUF664 domain-containing protein [Streptomyces sp. NPDC087300]|uniref:mycothiol transferase n=1 Tax=Streptomyces sp. NPDC087300 TaxID=3365780 RepID=UPI00382021A3